MKILKCDRKIQIILFIFTFLILTIVYWLSPTSMKFNNKQNLPQVYEDRQKHLHDKCEENHNKIVNKYKEFSPNSNFKNIVSKAKVLHNENDIPFLFCQIPKVASTSWTQIFVNVW